MRKRLTAATLAALMALSMTACSGGKAAETTAAPETKVEETKAEESKAEETKAETEAAKDGEKKPEDYTGSVVVYSPHDADPLNAGVNLFMEKYPNVKVEVVAAGTGELCNRIAAESVGINVTKFKLMSFTISAAIAGAGGVLYAHNLSTLTALPANFGYNMSIMILVFVVLGGIGNIRGSIIAAVILTLLPELLRGLSDYRMLIYSVLLIAMMLFNWAPGARVFRERMKSKLKKTKEEA